MKIEVEQIESEETLRFAGNKFFTEEQLDEIRKA